MTRRSRFSSKAGARSGALACWALVVASALACSSSARAPSLVSAGDPPGSGGRAGSADGEGGQFDLGGTNDAAAGDSGAAGDGGDSGTPATSGGNGGRPTNAPPVCDQLAAWSAATSVGGVSSAADEQLLALTPDELDLAFARAGALYVAHRASPSAPFANATAVTIPTGWSAAHGASLSADGKRLLLVSDPDPKKLGELRRSEREGAFSGMIDESPFAAINQDSDFTRRVYASPTISAGDDQLLFNSSLDTESTIVVSTRTEAGAWSPPRTLSAGIFDGSAGERRLPTGISSDGRTLFYFNEESAKEEARWRATSSPTSPLYDMLSLGARRGAAPNAACNRLYSQSNGDVVVEKD